VNAPLTLKRAVALIDGLAEPRPPEFSDDAIALSFVDQHADDLRYVALWNKWLEYDGTRWRLDETIVALDLARKICREKAADCKRKDLIRRALASAKTASAVLQLSRADRRIAATADQWDADPWALNTPTGMVELKTGKVRPHRRDDYMTKLTAVAPGGDCPLWHAFLNRITNGDEELQRFLQRLCGYALTALTVEHALFFAHGSGANGKTVFISTIAGILNDYHCAAPIETFTASKTDRHPTELADLHGARLVTATETEEGRNWAESRIKMLTGGDKVKARFMRQDLFEYVPQFKLLIAGNHKPRLRSVDEAIKRRVNLIPFVVTIPPKERDKDLGEKLKAEWPGILSWMIEGCMEWQRMGLQPPTAVQEATAQYIAGEDTLAAWIEECCELAANYWERTQTLFASWTGWADRSGEERGDTKQFRARIESKPDIYHKREPGTGRTGYQGIRLRAPDMDRNW
jgi:putative DNA primase/helicase